MKKLMAGFNRFWKEEEGATAVEYGIMVALIAAVIIVSVGLIGNNLDQTFNYVAGEVLQTGS